MLKEVSPSFSFQSFTEPEDKNTKLSQVSCSHFWASFRILSIFSFETPSLPIFTKFTSFIIYFLDITIKKSSFLLRTAEKEDLQ
ncbi:MAG: hypothetical protein H6767_07820 [Candidatus Peribacteria bacterium]|nr:MAG: hypothetical protein H6767_07820 [Candidatus Peribacteria bacterium]